MAEAFLGPKPEKHDLHHIDGDTANDSCANLEYVPKTLHRSAHNSGEANNAAVLCWNDVNTIRILYNKASFSQRGLATIYGVGKTTVARIVNRTHWRER